MDKLLTGEAAVVQITCDFIIKSEEGKIQSQVFFLVCFFL